MMPVYASFSRCATPEVGGTVTCVKTAVVPGAASGRLQLAERLRRRNREPRPLAASRPLIARQRAHHSRMSFDEELKILLERNGIQVEDD